MKYFCCVTLPTSSISHVPKSFLNTLVNMTGAYRRRRRSLYMAWSKDKFRQWSAGRNVFRRAYRCKSRSTNWVVFANWLSSLFITWKTLTLLECWGWQEGRRLVQFYKKHPGICINATYDSWRMTFTAKVKLVLPPLWSPIPKLRHVHARMFSCSEHDLKWAETCACHKAFHYVNTFLHEDPKVEDILGSFAKPATQGSGEAKSPPMLISGANACICSGCMVRLIFLRHIESLLDEC